jgi:energy-coupling factor transporter transmembrane protein EcfT
MSVGYLAGNGPLRRAHPFTPLTLAAVLAVLAFALPAPWGTIAACMGAIAVPVIEGIPGVVTPAALTALPFWIFAFVIHGLLRHAPLLALGLGARFTTIIVAFLTLLGVVQPARLVDALLARGISFPVAYIFAATLQSVPRLKTRAREILDAQRCRGLAVGGSPWGRSRAVVPLVVPLILSALAEVDHRSFALETRGAGHVTRRTPLHPPPDTTRQRFARWALVALTVGVVVWSIAR